MKLCRQGRAAGAACACWRAEGAAGVCAPPPLLPRCANQQLTPAQCRKAYAPYLLNPDWAGPGPLRTSRLPRLEHTCASCFPTCVGTNCIVRVDVVYPRGGADLGLGPPYPLAILSSGFLVSSDAYTSYAERLAEWG